MQEDLLALNVAQLKEKLREQGLPVSGKKQELVDRLLAAAPAPTTRTVADLDPDSASVDPSEVLDALPAEERGMQAFLRREGPMGIPMAGFVAVGVAAMLLTVVLFTTGVIGGGKEPNWQLIDYDPNQTEAYANGLLALGHPEWEGRMSGTPEEHAAAQSILENLTEMGYTPQMNSYPVDMFSVNSEPSLRMCPPGANPLVQPCGFGDIGAEGRIVEFQHRVDYVIQGFSGSIDAQFNMDVPLVDLGDGSDDGAWSSAGGAVGIVDSGGTTGGNTALMTKAIQNDLAGLIRINTASNCGLIESDDCVPIFKTVLIDDVKAANGGSVPDIAFIAVSNNTGQQMRQLASD
ncbi:MAG: SAP domain-containing protein, partial [Candidatus Thermoplasmatota archaeon]|nr:SAP domain-containing protein [Candidatus Thermoplasmatota archaeon]